MNSPVLAATSPSIEQAAYANYLRVRDEVVRMKAAAAGAAEAAPSRYWAEELGTIDYMLDASPLIVRKLRHHAFHITGLRPYDYREYADRQVMFERRLQALAALAGGTDLLVPEAEPLGGYGYSIGGRLYNVDTIKFFEVFAGLHRAGILDVFRAPGGRRLVWEIGGGWGGFAYQFRTLFPNTTYIIVDFPELFLFSATYLATMFPQARLRYWREGERTLAGWPDADFVFVPNDRVDELRGLAADGVQPDLLVNLVSFQEMTGAQVDAYLRLAASIGCRAVYSLNRDRSHYNDEIDSVGRILSRHYDVREIRLLGSDYTKAIKKDSAISVEEAAQRGTATPDRYRHLAGTLRPSAPHRGACGDNSRLPAPNSQIGRAVVSSEGAGQPFTSRQGQAPLEGAPHVGIGVTLHNRAMFLPEALDSLLAQTYRNFRLVLVDDGSSDASEAIARAYEQRDPRVRYVRFDQRRGMVAAWRSAFELATEDGAEYFAWASDHDRWHPEWLATLVAELEEHPEAVLAYPLTRRTDVTGLELPKVARQFETVGVSDVRARWKLFSRSDAVAAGDMVYGLMRPEAARRAGIFREVLCPDRLLMAELTVQGQIRQVPHVLWFRRQFTTGSLARQRSSLFAAGAQRPGVLTPPWYMHARSLWRTYGQPGAMPGIQQSQVARMVAGYTFAYARRHYAKTPTQRDLVWLLQRPRWAMKHAKRLALLATFKTLVAARRAGITPWLERTCERFTGRARPWRRAA